MSTLTLPLVAGAPYDGRAWYAARTVADVDPDKPAVIWLDEPTLTDRTLRWARDSEVKSPHVALTPSTVAELLFDSPLDPADGPTNTLLCDTVMRQLSVWHCDIKTYIGRVYAELAAHPEVAQPRMAWCLELAARIVRTEVPA